MRIECKNCKSIYRVDSSKIPTTGALITCKKCGMKIQLLPEPPNPSESYIEIDESNQIMTKGPTPSNDIPENKKIEYRGYKDKKYREHEELEYASFIQKNANKYLKKFKKFETYKGSKYAFTWHWPAFFFPQFWFLYRKLYVLGIFFLLVSLIMPISPFVSIISGCSANYIYFRNVKDKISFYKKNHPNLTGTELFVELEKIGGVSPLNVVVGLLTIIVLFLVLVISTL